jgi:methionine synthase reductase
MEKTGAYATPVLIAAEAGVQLPATPCPSVDTTSPGVVNGQANINGTGASDGHGSTIILFGSQTGNAEAVAGRIHKDVCAKGGSCTLMSMKDYETIDLSLERLVVCVVSTTGQGDPPDNASKFFRFIKGRSNSSTMLAAWRFGVLGLGDTNYDQFCKPAKVLDKRLEELGARRFVTGATGLKGEHGGPNGAADDAEGGQEECIEPWVKHLLDSMHKTGYLEPSAKRARLEEAPSATDSLLESCTSEARACVAAVPTSRAGEGGVPTLPSALHLPPPAQPPQSHQARARLCNSFD